MGTYILILMMHVGPMGNGNSNSLTTAEFSSKEKCEEAGKAATQLAKDTTKEIKYICARK